jgi:ABC-type multidrug transport system ATPase subunit
MEPEYITAVDVEKHYGEKIAMQAINFSIPEKEIFGFIGPDGAGKTTLFRVLTTLVKPNKGKITVGGHDVVRDYKILRRKIGYMPGRFSLYLDLSVEENLKFYATIFGTSIEANYHLIEDIYKQIEPFKNRLAKNLSGGMKQKLALSCALIHDPDLLVLDEPTTGVDAVSRVEFWEMLKRLKDKNITIVVSTPYMDEAMLCDRVALMQDGGIMAINSPEGIIKSFDKDIYAVRAKNFYRMMQDIRKYDHVYSAFPFGQHVHYIDKREDFREDDLLVYLKERGHDQVEINRVPPGIEDCFMDLMKGKEKKGGVA